MKTTFSNQIESMTALLQAAFPGQSNESRRSEFLASFEEALSHQAVAPQTSVEPLVVTLLGRCTIQNKAGVVDERAWRTQKSMLLFAYLAARTGRPVSDGLLAGTFWPESDEERSRCSLRNAIHQVRSTLAPLTAGAELMERSRRCRTVTMTTPCVLDTELFESGVTEAGELFAEGRHAEALERLQAALALYRGEFLEGFMDEWILTARSHYADLHLQAQHLLARCHLALGNAAEAERAARQAVALDCFREDLHADLIQALTMQDRRGEALRYYRNLVALFQTEMGVVPSSLHDIYDELLAEGGQRMASSIQVLTNWQRNDVRRPATRAHLRALAC